MMDIENFTLLSYYAHPGKWKTDDNWVYMIYILL